jgi:hypothetical protein
MEVLHHDRMYFNLRHLQSRCVTKIGGDGVGYGHANSRKGGRKAVLYFRTARPDKRKQESDATAENEMQAREEMEENEEVPEMPAKKASKHIDLNILAARAGLELKLEKPKGIFYFFYFTHVFFNLINSPRTRGHLHSHYQARSLI